MEIQAQTDPPQDSPFLLVFRSTGRLASSAPSVLPKGSSDVSCPGKTSISGNAASLASKAQTPSADPSQPNETQAGSPSSRKPVALIAGITVPLVLILLVGLVIIFIRSRRRQKSRDIRSVEPFDLQLQDSRKSIPPSPSNWRPPPSLPQDNGSSAASTHVPKARSKAHEAGYGAEADHRGASSSEGFATLNRSNTLARSYSDANAQATISETDTEVIIQHHDAGPRKSVKELPPPYLDRISP